jgi:hypothetical protein
VLNFHTTNANSLIFFRLAAGFHFRSHLTQALCFQSICAECENTGLGDLFVTEGVLTIHHVISRLEMRRRMGLSISKEIEFMAFHCLELAIPISEFSIDDLSEILSSPSLKLRSEDLLCESLIYCVAQSAAFFALFEFIHFENLSASTVESFTSLTEQ